MFIFPKLHMIFTISELITGTKVVNVSMQIIHRDNESHAILCEWEHCSLYVWRDKLTRNKDGQKCVCMLQSSSCLIQGITIKYL